jgi:acetyltransferase-like isoleucine patch superfamily enzyme
MTTMIKNFLRYSFLGKLILYLYYRAQSTRQHTGANVMFGSIVNRSILGRSVTVFQNCNVSHSELGDYSYLAEGGRIGRTHIGKFSCIGPNFLTGLGMHPTHSFVSSHPAFYSATPPTGPALTEGGLFSDRALITIGNDVWIGANVVVFDGVKIGDGAIIGAGAVVNRDIPPYAIAVGVPCKVVRFRFDENEIRQLLELRWWDQSEEWIADNAHRFTSVKNMQK